MPEIFGCNFTSLSTDEQRELLGIEKRTKIAFNQFFLRKSNENKMSAKPKSCSGNLD